jgi:aminoglycoside phosphotransferase (APT) family kinase protein
MLTRPPPTVKPTATPYDESMAWQKPTTEEIRAALREYAPSLADETSAFLGEGWEFWAFTAGDHVLRFPMRGRGSVWKLAGRSSRESLEIERALTPALARSLPFPTGVIDVFGETGPNGAPFAGHRFVPGEVVMSGNQAVSASFGVELGRLIGAIRAFPPERAIALGVPLFEGPALRQERLHHYEDVIRRVFPLVSCEARTYIERVYEAYLNDPACFEFEPVFVHTDLAVNTLVGPDGSISGLIDFGDCAVSSPALDLWLPAYGFEQLGIAGQKAACFDEAGIDEGRLEQMAPELAFLHVRYPLLGILHGLNIEDAGFVEEAIHELNALVPFGIEYA